MAPKKHKPRSPRRVPQRKFNPVANKHYRFQMRLPITEKGMHPAPQWHEFNMLMSNHPFANHATAYRVHRVGVQVYPMTNCEFIIREEVVKTLTTRLELQVQQDLLVFGQYRDRPVTYWRTPSNAIFKGWQDMENATHVFQTGLDLFIYGQNHDTAGADGLAVCMILDVSLKGINTGFIAVDRPLPAAPGGPEFHGLDTDEDYVHMVPPPVHKNPDPSGNVLTPSHLFNRGHNAASRSGFIH